MGGGHCLPLLREHSYTQGAPFSSRGSSDHTCVTYMSFHFISYCCRHHDTADDGHQDEVQGIHEAGAGRLFYLGAAFAAQGTSSGTAAAGQLKSETKKTRVKNTPKPSILRFLLQKLDNDAGRLPAKVQNFSSPLLPAEQHLSGSRLSCLSKLTSFKHITV